MDDEPDIAAEQPPSGPRPLNDLADGEVDLAWAMVEASPDALVMVGDDGLIELVNQQTELLFGYDRGELLGRPVEVLLPVELASAHELHRANYGVAPEARAMGNGMELLARRADGSEFTAEISLSPLRMGGVARTIAAVRDVTESRTAKEHTRLIQHTVDSVSDALFICDEQNLEFTYVNQGAVDLHGYSREELLNGMTPRDLAPTLPFEDIQIALERLGRAPTESARMRAEGLRKDGTTMSVEVQINWPAPSRAHGPRPVIAVVRDVTEQVTQEAAAKSREAWFQAAFGEGPVPMAIVGIHPPDGRDLFDVNQALADLFGYTREELIGRPAADLIHAADVHPDTSAAMAVAAGLDAEYSNLVRGIRSDGSQLWLQRHVSALDPDGDQDKLIVHVVDVTSEIEAEISRRRQEALTAALSDIRLRMLQGASRAEGLKLICESAKNLLDAVGAVVLTPTDADETLHVEASSGVPDSVKKRMSFRRDQGAAGEVFQSGQPQYLNTGRHPTTPDKNREILEEQQVGPTLMAPLPFGDDVAGVLIVIRLDSGEPFTDQDLDPIRQFAVGAVTAMDLAKARTNEAELEMLQDRDRIGRDIHENVIGQLFGTGMNLVAAMNQLEGSPAIVKRLTEAVADIDKAIKDIRAAIFEVESDQD